MIVLSLFGSINYAKADVIIPTITNVYFEQDGKPYNNKIEFTVKGYGYYKGNPGMGQEIITKEPGTYTPEVVD